MMSSQNNIKKIILALIMFPAVTLAMKNDVQIQQFDAYCLTRSQLEELINGFEEVPFIRMLSSRPSKNGGWETFSTVMFMTADQKSWTLVEKRQENFYCVIGMGRQVEPVDKNTTDKPISKDGV